MKTIRLLVTLCVLSCLASAVLAHADTCATGSLSNVLGTTCTIGDKTFTFSSAAQDQFTGISAAQILFTTNTSDPLSPGFSFSSATGGPISLAATPGANSNELINVGVNYTVSVTDGSASLLGQSFTLSGATVNLTGLTGDNTISDATNFLGSMSGASVEVFLQCQVPAGPTGCTTSQGPVNLTSGGTFATPQVSAVGQAGFELAAQTTSGRTSASLTSVSYNFNEAPQGVPEPSSVLLLGTGLVGFAMRRFKNRI